MQRAQKFDFIILRSQKHRFKALKVHDLSKAQIHRILQGHKTKLTAS